MELKKIKILSIKKTNRIAKVYDISVERNHNFFIGDTQTLTHNCDYVTINGQAALRNLMETFSSHARFILTCNYVDRIIPAIQSRCQVFQIIPPNKKDVAERIVKILINESITYDIKDVSTLVNE